MTHLNRSPLLIMAGLVLLAACGGTASSSSATRTPTAAPAAMAAVLVKGEFVGDAGSLAGIALSTNGRQVIAYLCNGSRHVSLAEWFKGPVTGGGIDITNAHGAHLVATVYAQAITGTVTLKDGRSAPFAARLLPDPGRIYGLFRSEETFKGVHYLGGWILVPLGLAVAPAETLSWAAPAATPSCGNSCLLPRDGGAGIINERTGALIVGLPIQTSSPRTGSSRTVTVPGLGKFRLTACRQAQC